MKKVHGIGINDYEGTVSYVKNGKRKKIKSYATWNSMVERCYSNKFQEKQPTYKGCEVSKEWLLYSNFKKWFDNNFPFELSEEIRFEIDKDLMIKGNKIYSEKTCLFLPKKINSFLANKQNNNASGYVGVDFVKREGKFRTKIRDFNTGKQKSLGYFIDPFEASEVYAVARKYNSMLARKYMQDLGIYSYEVVNKIK